MKPDRDTLFSGTLDCARSGTFVFDQRVAAVFDDMVSRSVPGYGTIQLLTADIALSAAHLGTIYDIGCSTGETIAAITTRAVSETSIVGVDNSEAMIAKCSDKVKKCRESHTINLICENVVNENPYRFGLAGAIIFNLVLQFIRPLERHHVLRQAWENLAPGGSVIVVEKTVEEDPELNAKFIDYYHRFKKEMGYSELEISSKREALENVLIPFRKGENIALLREAGFSKVGTFFQWFNFCGFLAIR